ncbi:hypothetical protein EJB05_48787, partial [Eragrostis curvula]
MDAAPPQRRPRLPPPGAEQEAFLGPLPPELLDGILSRLPLSDAVRTSALARAWRRRWESVPSLKFKWGEGADPGAITDVLQRYSCPVSEFRHSRVGKESFRHSKRWLRLLALKAVQHLSLDFEWSPELVHTLSRSIFSCRELTFLSIDNCIVPAMPPLFAGYPHLISLRLSCVCFPEGAWQLELLIAASPLLENLCLQQLQVPYSDDMPDPWVIEAPKLRHLVIIGFFDHGWQISDLPSLEDARINCESGRDFAKLMTGVAGARDLDVAIPDGNGNILEGLSRPFNNLKSLLLRMSLSLLSSVSTVFCLLRSAPKLEDLTIELNDGDYDDDEVGNDFLNAQWADDLFSTLVHVSVMNMMCKLSEMHFVEFVLSKARRLQQFHVYLDKDCPKSNEDVITKLAKYRRASPRAKVFFERLSDD